MNAYRAKTTPTEENIVVPLANAATHYGYLAYAEFPIVDDAVLPSVGKPGPIDLVLPCADHKEIVLVEAKTGQTTWRKQVHADFQKLKSLTSAVFFGFSPNDETLRAVTTAFMLNVAWVEDVNQGKRLLGLKSGARPIDEFDKDYVDAKFKDVLVADGRSLYLVYFASENTSVRQ